MNKKISSVCIILALMTALSGCSQTTFTEPEHITQSEIIAESTAADTFETALSTESVSEESIVSETVQEEHPDLVLTDENIKNLCENIAKHYNNNSDAKGNYIVFDNECTVSENTAECIVRYQCSDEEADEIIANGGIPNANEYVTLVTVDIAAGKATDEQGSEFDISFSVTE